jgi:hypothetical protein
VKPRALRTAFLNSGLALDPLVEGVRQESLESLHRTLAALADEYAAAPAERQKRIRSLVITARQHAEWASRRVGGDETRRAAKAEMALWIRTWLENPPLFRSWAALRLKALE